MTKKKQNPKKKSIKQQTNLFAEQMIALSDQSYIFRREALTQMLNPGIDINYECGYPLDITLSDYKGMFDRDALAKRVVQLIPAESWAMPPKIFETEDAEETVFEKEWETLQKEKNVYQYLERIDILSGMAEFGVLLLGIDDGEDVLSKPVEGIDEKTGEGSGGQKHKLLFLKPFSQDVIKIKNSEADVHSPRFGLPTLYAIDFENPLADSASNTIDVHWTRVIHVADNRETSEVLGVSRMKPVYNRLLDVRKVLSGSGTMFWNGAYPGFALNLGDTTKSLTTDDKTRLREELQDYRNGLQRYLALQDVEIQTLAPQVADPGPHLLVQIQNIALLLGVPFRILMGSEAAHLASDQDIKTWNMRVAKRRDSYVSSLLIRPLIDRLIAFGVLTKPEEYFIEWPDLNAPGEKESAEIAGKKTEAFAKYVSASVDQFIPPKEYLMKIMGMEEDEADAIVEAADEYVEDQEDERESELDDREEVAGVREAVVKKDRDRKIAEEITGPK